MKTYFLEITWFRPEKTFEFLISWENPLNFGEDLFFVGDHQHSAEKKPWISDFGRKNPLNFGEDFFFCLEITSNWPEKKPWISDFGRKKPLNFVEDLFFFGDHLILTEKPPESNLRLMKIWVKFVFGCIKLPKKPPPPPPPLRNPGYATAIDNKVICTQCILSCLIRISIFWIVTGCF